MDAGAARREACRPRKVSCSSELLGANAGLQDGEAVSAPFSREAHLLPAGGLSAAARRAERSSSAPQVVVHQRHMPMEPKKFHIPRKTKEQRALFQPVSMETREYEDLKSILTCSYIDPNSAGRFAYSRPRLVHSELLEKEFVEKRKEMKAEGRTEKELEESYCFLLANSEELPLLCEKGLTVGHSGTTLLGNPSKGVYLSKYSDLLQTSPFTSGATGEIIIFKVMKGKVKSIYENMKNLLDPTPRFDAHIAKNASKVTSLSCFRAFDLTQQYFYEYSFDELRPRPRHVCPHAVVFFQVKGKDAPPPSSPLVPSSRSTRRSCDRKEESSEFTVWTGDLVKEDRVLLQISLQSSSPPFLPHRLPEKLQIGNLLRIDHVTRMLPSGVLCYNSYSGSREVVNEGFYCSLLEVTSRNRSTSSVTALLRELELHKVVLVSPLPDRGFLLLLSSVQMAAPADRREDWKRRLHALFVFQETRDVAKLPSRCDPSTLESSWSLPPVMPHLSAFIPALHHALIKARANRPANLPAGVEHQAQEYYSGLKDGSVPHHRMPEYDSVLDDEGKSLPPPKHHHLSRDSYLHSYLSGPDLYLLPLVRAKRLVEAHCGPEPPQEPRSRNSHKAPGRETQDHSDQRVRQLLDLVMTCKRNAENELRREKGERPRALEKKRKMEQETAERALKYFKASQEPAKPDKTAGNRTPPAPLSLSSVMQSFGLQDADLKGNGSELTATLISQLTGLIQTANQNLHETQGEGPKESNLATACDVDLQEELEEQTVGSISSLEGFSPGSHSGETHHHGDGGRGGLRRRVEHPEEEEEEENWPIPWILIPITGLSSERYSQRDRNLPQDPRFQAVTAATGPPTAAAPSKKSPAPSPEHSPPLSPAQCPSPVPSPPTCPSQCPSPQPSPPPSPSQCPSPESSPPSSPLLCPSSDPDDPMPPAPSEHSAPPPSPSPSHELKKPPPCDQQLACANEQHPAPPPPWEFPGVLKGGAVEKPPHSPPTLPPGLPAAGSWTSPSAPLEGNEAEELTPPPSEETDVKLDGRQEEGAVLGGSRRAELRALAEAPPPSTSSSCPVDLTVDKHLGDFSSEMQLLLQEEGVYYNSQQPPPSAVHSEPPTCLRTVPCVPIPSFSHYVTLYHPSPPVHDYMVSLQSSLNGMMAAFEGVCASQRADAGHADASLANTVRDFVASVRAANAPTGSDDAPFVCSEQTDGSVRLHAELLGGGGARRSESADCSPPPGVALPDLSSGSRPVYKSGSGSMETSIQNSRATVRIAHEEEEGVPTGPACTGTGPAPSEPSCKLGTSIAPPPEPELCPGPAPSSKDLNSVIHQLQPDVINNLLEIMKDIKKKSPQFYIHCPEAGDRACEEVKDELLRLGNVQQSPADFLSQENPESGLLVVMRNKDIAAHVHEIPGLVALKRRPSVVFVGIDSQDDLKSSGWTELFVSGGCIVSDELLLNPDAITCDRLAALLQLLEQHSSPQSLWRWKIHSKTQRKLKEQARFRRDAANLLDLLSAYQKRQVVEVLPHHRCDTLNVRSPDLDCLLQLQAQHTQFRHMVFLTEHHVDQPLLYSGGGIIVADVEETLQSLSRLAGRHNPTDKCLFLEELLAPKGLCKPNTDVDPVPECSAVPEPPDQLQGINKPPEIPPLPCSSRPPGPEASDQLFSDAASKHRPPLATSRDMEFLQQAIKQLRAERQEQLQRLRLQRELLQSQAEPTPPKPPGPINGHNPPLLTPPIPNRKAVQSPPSDPLSWDRGGGAPAAEGQQEGGAEGNCTAHTEDPFDPPPHQNTTAVGPRGQREAGGKEREEESEEGGGATRSPAGGDISQEAVREVAVSSTSAEPTQSSSGSSVAMETDEKKSRHPAQPLMTSQPPSYCQLRQRSVGLLQTPHLPSIYAQFLPPRPTRGFMRPTHLWQGTGPPLVWGFQQTRMEFLGGYYSPAGGNMHRGGRRGGGFNGL